MNFSFYASWFYIKDFNFYQYMYFLGTDDDTRVSKHVCSTIKPYRILSIIDQDEFRRNAVRDTRGTPQNV